MKPWVLGKEYKFADESCERAFIELHPENQGIAEYIHAHGGSFMVIDVYQEHGQVTQVTFRDGMKSEPDSRSDDIACLPINVCLLDSDIVFFDEVDYKKECAEEATQVKKSFTLCVDLPIPETKEEAIAHINRIKAIFGIEA